MNTTSVDSTDHGSDQHLGGITLGLCLGILIILVLVAYASYKCKRVQDEMSTIRNHYPSVSIRSVGASTDHDDYATIAIQHNGLDEPTLLSSFPHFTYSNLKAHKAGDSTTSGCSICLSNYVDDDLLRLLPECGHIFHVECVDPWLVLHSTCPLCRIPLAPAASGPT